MARNIAAQVFDQYFDGRRCAQVLGLGDRTFARATGSVIVQGGRGPSDCSYLSPIRTLALTPGKVVEYEVVLALGTITELRRTFAQHPRP